MKILNGICETKVKKEAMNDDLIGNIKING